MKDFTHIDFCVFFFIFFRPCNCGVIQKYFTYIWNEVHGVIICGDGGIDQI